MNTNSPFRCVDKNTEILQKILKLRNEAAILLGFKSHADYMLSQKMAKTPQKAQEFLEMLSTELSEVFKKDLNILVNVKKELTKLVLFFVICYLYNRMILKLKHGILCI